MAFCNLGYLNHLNKFLKKIHNVIWEYKIFFVFKKKYSRNKLIKNTQLVEIPLSEKISEPVHPSIFKKDSLYFLAFTPFPNSCSKKEWPCVVAGTKPTQFKVFGSSSLPVVESSKRGHPHDYLNDPELIYNFDTEELWLYYIETLRDSREGGSVCVGQRLMLSKTKDGCTWTTPIVVRRDNFVSEKFNSRFLVSPSIVYIKNRFSLFMVDLTDKRKIVRLESKDGVEWVNLTDIQCALPYGLIPWHISTFSYDSYVYLLVSATITHDIVGNVLLLGRSADTDTLRWDFLPEILLKPSKNFFNSKLIYRSAAIVEHDTLKLFVSFKNKKNKWNTAYGEFPMYKITREFH